MPKEYNYRCKNCNHLFIGGENATCPNCGGKNLRKLMFWELIKAFIGKKIKILCLK
jgi:DNA-directed RNA polymerase subunit RPC12/RpoP